VKSALMEEYNLSSEVIQIVHVESKEMKEFLEKRFQCGSQDQSWPLFACNGTPVGTLDDLHSWVQRNWDQLQESAVHHSATVSCASLVCHDADGDDIYQSTPLCSSLDVSSICSEDQDFLTQSQVLDLSYLSVDSESTEGREEVRFQKREELRRAMSEAFDLDQGAWSSWMDWAASKLNSVVTYWTGESDTAVLPTEFPSLIVPVLRQNEFFCWQRRLLFFYDKSFARFDPSSESPRDVRAFSDITTTTVPQKGVLIVGYASGQVDYFYSDREETWQILLSRLRPRT